MAVLASTRRRATVQLALLLAPWSSAVAATAPEIVNGANSHQHPTTAAILYADGAGVGAAAVGCSGTLIGCRTVLTAAHCVEGERASQVFVFLQHGGIFPVSRISLHPRWEALDADVAVLRLGTPVTGIAPSAINRFADPAAATGAAGVIAGFGITSGDGDDAGIKRAGNVVTTSCGAASGGQLSDRTNICWRHTGALANTCSGDSGGPLFLTFGGQSVVAGVTSGGLDSSCGPGDVSYDANVYLRRSFVLAQLGTDSTAACGGLPAVGNAATAVVGRGTHLGAGQEVRYQLTLGAGARELRLALSGADDGNLDADLFARRGAGDGAWECRQEGSGVFGACRFAAPAAGTWTVLVRAKAGAGEVQLTATAFGASLTADAGNGGGGGGGGGGGNGSSCRGACGDSPDGSCWCDAECAENGDCCADYRAVCSAGSCRQQVCAVDAYCCAVDWDEECDDVAAQVCR
jgi:hypothetical protein